MTVDSDRAKPKSRTPQSVYRGRPAAEASPEAEASAGINIGSDTVVRNGPRLTIFAAAPMPDWEVRRFRRAAILYGDDRYFVAAQEQLDGGLWKYVLHRWPEQLDDLPAMVVRYDESYVRQRDEHALELRRKWSITQLMGPAQLLLFGFLPSGIKTRLHEKYGFHPRKATIYSVLIELYLTIGLGALQIVALFTGILPDYQLLLVIVTPLLLLDVAIRWSRYFTGSFIQYGFFEWLFRPRLKKD